MLVKYFGFLVDLVLDLDTNVLTFSTKKHKPETTNGYAIVH